MTEPPDHFGPWVPGLDPAERLARLRSLRSLVQIFGGARHPLAAALARAEVDDSDESARAAWALLMELPARPRRNVLCSFATLLRNTPPSKEQKHG